MYVNSSCRSSSRDMDPHELSRYFETHARYYNDALREIKSGHKRSCWMWYIFPTPPWIVNGVERGSMTNQYYSLRTDDQAIAYLNSSIGKMNLRNNYIEITTAARDQLKNGNDVYSLFGGLDVPKFKSSIKYFNEISQKIKDKELQEICGELLELLENEKNREKPKRAFTWRLPSSSDSDDSSEKDETDKKKENVNAKNNTNDENDKNEEEEEEKDIEEDKNEEEEEEKDIEEETKSGGKVTEENDKNEEEEEEKDIEEETKSGGKVTVTEDKLEENRQMDAIQHEKSSEKEVEQVAENVALILLKND